MVVRSNRRVKVHFIAGNMSEPLVIDTFIDLGPMDDVSFVEHINANVLTAMSVGNSVRIGDFLLKDIKFFRILLA